MRPGIRCPAGHRRDLGDPRPGYPRDVQHGERGTVILEALALCRPPHGYQVFLGAKAAGPWREQAPEPDIAARASLIEQQERRHPRPARRPLVRPVEDPAQQQVALPLRVVKLPAGRPVVAEISEGTGMDVQGIRPVGLGSRGVQHRQPDRIPGHASVRAEPTLVANRQQPCQRIIARIPGRPAAVDTLKNQVRIGQVIETHGRGRIHGHSLPQASRPQPLGRFERIFEFKSSIGNMYSSDHRSREADDEQHG